MPTFRLVGTVSRQLVTGTLEPIPGAKVWHVVENCCEDFPGATKSEQTTGVDGSYDMTFTGGDNAHFIRCTIPDAVVATARYEGVWVTFGILKDQPLDFVFAEPEAALPAHPCRGLCSTKETPCKRHTTNVGHCYQHTSQDTVVV